MRQCAICSKCTETPPWLVELIKQHEIGGSDQRSASWYKTRARMVTASDVPSILGKCRFFKKSSETVWRGKFQKLNACNVEYREAAVVAEVNEASQSAMNEATQFGIDHEDDACEMYQNVSGHRVVNLGLLVHS